MTVYTLLHTLAIARMCNKSWACHCEWEGSVGVCRVGQSSPQLMGLINKGEFKPPGWKVQVRLASRVCIMQGFPWSCFLPQKVFRGRWPLQGQREGRDEGWHNTHFIPTGGASWCAGVGLCAFRVAGSGIAEQTEPLCPLSSAPRTGCRAATSPWRWQRQSALPGHKVSSSPRRTALPQPGVRRGWSELAARPRAVRTALHHSRSPPALPTPASPPPVHTSSLLAFPCTPFAS